MPTRPAARIAPTFRRRMLQALAVALLVLTATAIPSQTAVAGNVPTTTTSTFELVPESGLIRVTVELAMTNLIPATTSGNVRTDYFINEGAVAVDEDGQNFAATTTGGSASVSVDASDPAFLPTATLRFPNTFYNQSRTVTLTYDIPGGAPRSDNVTRAGMAYASFCGFAASVYAGDPESFRIILPGRYIVEQFAGDPLEQTTSGGKVVLTRPQAPTPTDEAWHGACIEATDEAAFVTAEHTSPGGIRVTTKAWPGDTEWETAISAQVGPTMDALETALGRRPPTDSITIHEVIAEALGGYIGDFDPDTGNSRVSEDALEPVVAAHELAHAWFNQAYSDEIWINEGNAEYFGRLVVDFEPCAAPDPAAMDLVELSDWAFLPAIPTPEDGLEIDAQYATACWIVTQVGDAVGEAAMRDIYLAAEDGMISYVGAPPAEQLHSRIITWQDWLDLVDERGLVPAGETDLDWLQTLLVEVGAAPGPAAELEDRSAARQRYHELAAATGWSAPFVIREDMATWDFTDADESMAVAENLDAARDQAVGLVPSVADSNAVEDLYVTAEDTAGLAAALDEAEAELEAAEHVAAALTAAEVEPNPIEAIGLLGADLDADAATAVDQLTSADFESATATADGVVEASASSALSGALRIGLVLLAVVALGGGIWFWRRRRALQLSAQTTGPADAADAPDASEATTAEPTTAEPTTAEEAPDSTD